MKDRKKDFPYTEGIRDKLITAVMKIEAPPNVNAEFQVGVKFMKEEAIKSLNEAQL